MYKKKKQGMFLHLVALIPWGCNCCKPDDQVIDPLRKKALTFDYMQLLEKMKW